MCMKTLTVVYSCNWILLSNKNEQTFDTCNIDESQEHSWAKRQTQNKQTDEKEVFPFDKVYNTPKRCNYPEPSFHSESWPT